MNFRKPMSIFGIYEELYVQSMYSLINILTVNIISYHLHFSKLTLSQDCCSILVDEALCFQGLLSLLDKYPERSDITVRVCFVLGNLTVRNDDCRYCLFNAPNAMEIMLTVFRGYFSKDLKVRLELPNCQVTVQLSYFLEVQLSEKESDPAEVILSHVGFGVVLFLCCI